MKDRVLLHLQSLRDEQGRDITELKGLSSRISYPQLGQPCSGKASGRTREIAQALEQGQHRFLWSLCRPPSKGKMEYPSDYANLEHALPEGFLGQTAPIRKVIGGPQVAALAHPVVGVLGLGVEVKKDYRRDVAGEQDVIVVSLEELKKAIKVLMETKTGEELRKKVKEMKEKCRVAIKVLPILH
ncbi:UDP-glycosyltransferase 71A16-like [Punica granatum]|uniref:UDP-glycosyltransferase 71A16-like n=1 Tax=Punica granatum TaxID=22663 RepID=A0A6P8CRS8_PUNGR|nr:UDP-glycosyltransferase 71A16-like [Punica granatum]